MKLAEKSRLKIEEFFREYLEDDAFQLPEIYFYGGKFTHYLTSYLKIEGITIGRRIYILPSNFRATENKILRIDEELAVHEIVHVLQYRREGFWKFLLKYLRSYRTNLKGKEQRTAFAKAEAYFEIPYEIEARQIASSFSAWSKNRKNN